MNNAWQFLAALVLAIGISVAGFFVQDGLVNLRGNSRNVEVKGLSERYVEADIAVWDVSYEVSDESLTAARAQLKRNEATIRQFLLEAGVKESDIKVDRLSVYKNNEIDKQVDGDILYKEMYNINQTISARTSDVRAIEKAAQNTVSLIEQGILLKNATPNYIYTKLNDIKPDMIAEATRNAREAALKFAKDSDSEVGPILRASQGWFNILPRYGQEYGENESIEKKIRVITTIDFLLAD